MMREETGRLPGIDLAPAAPGEMRDERAERRLGADEAARSPPIDEVDMRVDLRQARGRGGGSARPICREGGEAKRRKFGYQVIGDPVPGRRQDRQRAGAE